jgi:hypothetical protein
MAYKLLGQVLPSGGSLTPLYICPENRQVVASTLFITNQSSQDATFRVSVAMNGESDATKHYLYYDEPIRAKRSYEVTRGITLQENCHIRVYSSNGQISFNLFGDERDEDS